MVQCNKLYFVLVYLREPEVMSLNFAEEPPGRSPHSIRKNSKNSPLVSFPSAWQMNTNTRCICNVCNKITKLIIYSPRRQLISLVCFSLLPGIFKKLWMIWMKMVTVLVHGSIQMWEPFGVNAVLDPGIYGKNI